MLHRWPLMACVIARHLSIFVVIFPNALVIFVDSPRDKAFMNYGNRSKRLVSLCEFRNVRHHPVERQVMSLRHQADVYLFNGGSIDNLMDLFVNWWR